MSQKGIHSSNDVYVRSDVDGLWGVKQALVLLRNYLLEYVKKWEANCRMYPCKFG